MARIGRISLRLSDGWPRDLVTVACIASIMIGVYQLSPDTSLQEVQKTGYISVCLPVELPPLVKGKGQQGHDVELLRNLAERMGLRLVPTTNTAIGSDFNPRNWRLSRAQCQMVAGGVVASPQVRSFMETVNLPVEVGWALLGAENLREIGSLSLGIYPGIGGLDRLKVSTELQSLGLNFTVFHDADQADQALQDGTVKVILTDSLTASILSTPEQPAHLLKEFERYPLAIALWRGDISLLKEVERHVLDMRKDGSLSQIYSSELN